MVGCILDQNYPNTNITPDFRGSDIYVKNNLANDVAQYFGKIVINSDEHLQNFLTVQSKFRRVRSIRLVRVAISMPLMGRMEETLRRTKLLMLSQCRRVGSLNSAVLEFCANLQKFELTWFNMGDAWMLRQYPALEAVSLYHSTNTIDELVAFLRLNPSIRCIELDNISGLMESRELVFASN